jgi:inosose dehydratase
MTRDAPRVRRAAVGSDFDSDRLEIVRDTVGAVAESMVAEADVTVALHPHVGTWVETDEETRYLLDSIDDTMLGFGPDIGHLYWAGADVPHLFHDFGDRVRGVHLKDYSKDIATRARTDGWSYQETVLAGVWREPGTGTEDLTGMLATLPADWSGPVVIEVDRAAAETPERSIALCGEWMKSKQNDYAPQSSRR